MEITKKIVKDFEHDQAFKGTKPALEFILHLVAEDILQRENWETDISYDYKPKKKKK